MINSDAMDQLYDTEAITFDEHSGGASIQFGWHARQQGNGQDATVTLNDVACPAPVPCL